MLRAARRGATRTISGSRTIASQVAKSNTEKCRRSGNGSPWNASCALEADEATGRALVHRAGLAEAVERRIRVVLERAAHPVVHAAPEVEQLPDARRIEGDAARGHVSAPATTTGMTRVVRVTYSS